MAHAGLFHNPNAKLCQTTQRRQSGSAMEVTLLSHYFFIIKVDFLIVTCFSIGIE
jgi:hypothetical protein